MRARNGPDGIEDCRTAPGHVSGRPTHRARLARRAWSVALLAGLGLAIAGCTTGPPPPVSPQELAGGELFPFFRVYWVGRYFLSQPLTAVDNRETYIPSIGESVDYGTCATQGGLLGGGPCQVPLQITTLVYVPHVNRSLGEQRNAVIRGVPAVVYDQGRQITLYSGHLEIDLSAGTEAGASAAANLLRPLNAPGSSTEALPPPTYCPGLSGPLSRTVYADMIALRAHLPKLACPRPIVAPETHPHHRGGAGRAPTPAGHRRAIVAPRRSPRTGQRARR